MTAASIAYSEPEWAARPSSSLWRLIEIKGGVEVASHDLCNRATTIFGRATDQVHLELHHESISRQHARISFDVQGNPWLRDLQSRHGTFVNKRRLPTTAVGKVESKSFEKGARGIMLFVGDIIKFGASSRYFLLEGPMSESLGNEVIVGKIGRLQQKKLSTTSPASSETTQMTYVDDKTLVDEGVSWGINMDDGSSNDIYDGKARECGGGAIDRSIKLDPLNIPVKYQKEFVKLNAMKYKLTNLEKEDNRILQKGRELTEGQQKQLARNAEREATLHKSIREREERLYSKVNSKSDGMSSKRKKGEGDLRMSSFEDGEDDFFDRAKNDSSSRLKNSIEYGAEEAESQKTLSLKWKACFHEQKYLATTALQKANIRVETLKSELKSMLVGGNEEAYFVQNELQLAEESKEKIKASLAKNEARMDEIIKLLKVVNSKIYCDRKSGYIGEGKPNKQPLSSPCSLEPQTYELVDSKTDEIQTRFQLSQMQCRKKASNEKTLSLARTPSQAALPDIRREESIINTSMPPPQLMRNESETVASANQLTTSSANKRKRIFGPMEVSSQKNARPKSVSSLMSETNHISSTTNGIGTLSFLNHITPKVYDRTKDTGSNNAEVNKEICQYQASEDSVSSSTMDVWRVPEGQDGSGKTKLNERFGGRY